MKKILLALLLVLSLLALSACGEKRIVHCDGCGKELQVNANSNMDEDWIILCEDCQKELDF